MKLRAGLIVLSVLAVLAIAAAIVVPPVVRGQLDKVFATVFTSQPSVGKIRFNPLTLTLTAHDFRIPAQGPPVFALGRLRIGVDILSPFRGAFTFRMVEFERPEVHLALQPDGTLNVSHLLKPLPAPAKPEEPPSLRFLSISVANGVVEWQDSTRTPVLERTLDTLAITLRDFRTVKQANNEYRLLAETAKGERLVWVGTFKMVPLTSVGHIQLTRLHARNVGELVGGTLPFELAGGEIDLGTHYEADASVTPAAFALDSLWVKLRRLELADLGADSSLIVVQNASTSGGRMDPAHMHVDLGRVKADGVRIMSWMQEDSHLNLEAWGQPRPGAPPDTAGPWLVTADSVEANGVDFTMEDRRLPVPARYHITDGRLGMRHMTTAPDSMFRTSVACSTGSGGFASGAGLLGLTPPVGDFQLAVKGFDLRVFQPYLDVFAKLQLASGTTDATGRLRFDAIAKKAPLTHFTGGVSLKNLRTRDLDLKQDFLTCRQLDLKQLDATVLPTRIKIADIVATGPYMRAVVAPDRTTNMQKVLTPPGPPPPAFAAATTDTPQVRIDHVTVRDGSAYFSDLTLQPGFTTGLQGMNGTISGLSSVKQTGGEIQLDGSVDKYAPVSISGKIDPLGGAGRSDVHLSFQHIELTTFTPYSGKFMGYPIRKGKLNLDLTYKVEGKELKGENKVFIEQLTLGNKVDSPDATRLPVRFAIALLKDKNGNIDLDVPVHGNLDDPKFSVGKVLLKVFVNLIAKAVSSPFKLLGAIAGGGGHTDLEGVEFEPGHSALDLAAQGTVDQLAKALGERPALRLEIEEAPDQVRDSVALARERYQQLLADAMTPAERATVASAGSLPPAEHAALIERAYTRAFGAPPKAAKAPKPRAGAPPDSAALSAEAIRISNMDVRLRQSAVVTQDEVKALARARVLAIKERLLAAGVTEERLFIVTTATPPWQPTPEELAAMGDMPADTTGGAPPPRDPTRVRVNLSLTGE